MAAGRVSPLLRRVLLAVYIVFLITLILTVIPISIVLKKLLHPLLKRRLAQAKHHYAQPSGE